MEIEFLYFSGCPNSAQALRRLRELLAAEGATSDIREIEVLTAEQAQRLRFLGSPSIRIDGYDIEPKARTRRDYGLMCRTYEGAGVPPAELMVRAIREHSGHRRHSHLAGA